MKQTQPKDPLLLDVFQALNEADIAYCLLRGLDELTMVAKHKEIDLLVAPSHLKLFEQAVAKYGFISLPSWGYAPHYFFVTYDEVKDSWLKLDVVTDLVYGRPIRHMRLEVAKQCLANRSKGDLVYNLSSEDELITLLLHCVLDKGTIKAGHRVRLKQLCQRIENGEENPRMLRWVECCFPAGISWHGIAQAIHEEDWSWFVGQESVLKRTLFWQAPVKNTWRRLNSRLLRLLRPLLFALHRRGIAVALLAPDGGGKSTLAKALARVDHLRARAIYMGGNVEASNVGLPTTRWLKEKAKSLDGNSWNPKQFIIKGLNFINRLLEMWYRSLFGWYHRRLGRCVIFDRYVYDSFLAPRAATIAKRFKRWLLQSGGSTPDMVLFLDAPGELLYLRKKEHSPELLEEQRQGYLKLKDRISNMIIVDASRSADEVRCEVTSLIWNSIGRSVLGKKKMAVLAKTDRDTKRPIQLDATDCPD